MRLCGQSASGLLPSRPLLRRPYSGFGKAAAQALEAVVQAGLDNFCLEGDLIRRRAAGGAAIE